MVCDWCMQMFPVREQYVTTPISTIHASAESLIYRWSLKQPASFRHQTTANGVLVTISLCYLLN